MLAYPAANHLFVNRGKFFFQCMYGNRMFSVVAAKLWNAVPQNLRDESEISMFKNLLKTFYFSVACGE